jgi:NAD+ synthase (glutamine-hydrolysing)
MLSSVRARRESPPVIHGLRPRLPVPLPHPLRLSIAQIRPRKGAVESNLERIREEIETASGGTDLLLFAETVTSGYFVEGGVEEVARTPAELALALGSPPPDAPDVILGAYERGPGATHFNSALHLTPSVGQGREARWEVVHVHRKVFLPTYGLFDESRFVQAGTRFRSYDTRFGRMGLLICEEMLHSLPPTILALDGAEVLLALSASPAREYRPGAGLPGSMARWDVAGRAVAMEHGLHLALAHLVGSEGGRIFAGGSAVYGPGARVLGQAALFDEDRLQVTLSRSGSRRARVRAPMLENLRLLLPHVQEELGRAARNGVPEVQCVLEREIPDGSPSGARNTDEVRNEGQGGDPDEGRAGDRESRGEIDPSDTSVLGLDLPLVERALISFLRDEIPRRRGFERVVVGVSGGVDSAVSLHLAARALGPENVHAFFLPYATSSPDSLLHGKEVCRSLGVEPRIIEITSGVDAYIESAEPDVSPLRRGNLAARFRGMVLFDQAARLDALPLGTGNKSERLLGYFTWHADDSPPINPLGDLLKTQVWALAQHLGVPESVVDKPPSADLVEGVHDEDELGVDYPTADLILHWLLEAVPPGELKAAGFDPSAVDRVWSRLQGTHWKRRPPTSALMSSSGIGDFYLRPVDF